MLNGRNFSRVETHAAAHVLKGDAMDKQGERSLAALIISAVAVTAALMVFGTGIAVGWKSSKESADRHWQQECIDRGVAEYDKATGRWQWTVEKKAEVSE